MKQLCHHDQDNCLYNLFLICSSIYLVTVSIVMVIKLIQKCCRHHHHEDRYICGCENQ